MFNSLYFYRCHRKSITSIDLFQQIKLMSMDREKINEEKAFTLDFG